MVIMWLLSMVTGMNSGLACIAVFSRKYKASRKGQDSTVHRQETVYDSEPLSMLS
jgi:hypothetical protein